MRVEVTVYPRRSTNKEFALVELSFNDGAISCVLDFDHQTFSKRFCAADYKHFEFFYFTLIVYAIDRMASRVEAIDNWTRSFDVTIPVRSPDCWNQASTLISDAVSFLTGDNWKVSFVGQQFELGRTSRQALRLRRSRIRKQFGEFSPKVVSLLSGGLDSLVGVIDWLEENPDESIFLVGHYDSPGPKSQQESLFNVLSRNYRNRCQLISLRAKVNNYSITSGHELDQNLRARSLVFLGLGILCASQFCETIPLLIPENGAIALNVPLTPARRGSLSTRTCHPFFLQSVKRIAESLDIQTPISNPLSVKTKGECVTECHNLDVLRKAAPISVSCAKAGHRVTWENRGADACGRCIPCIFRRAALHKAGMDTQIYGNDVCSVGVVDLSDQTTKVWKDLRAMLLFLRKQYSEQYISEMLLARGSLEIEYLSQYTGVVSRAMDEVRQFLAEKGSGDLRTLAGIV